MMTDSNRDDVVQKMLDMLHEVQAKLVAVRDNYEVMLDHLDEASRMSWEQIRQTQVLLEHLGVQKDAEPA